ncbi:diacylglycerol kinase iota-like [Hyperolius riggenbachi]|uniref:diacylglycerol kinase iota-like n=1 Tax=Hyperolius riggenbachi TaxID=752182 RepID=UPI0035A3220D
MNPPLDGAQSGCRGAEGGEPDTGHTREGEESVEDKLRHLTFRKQVSYRAYTSSAPGTAFRSRDPQFERKAISRSGLQHLAPVHCHSLSISNGPLKEPRTTLDWTENAVNGEHLWQETNVSGDLCYLGEDNCQVKFSMVYQFC